MQQLRTQLTQRAASSVIYIALYTQLDMVSSFFPLSLLFFFFLLRDPGVETFMDWIRDKRTKIRRKKKNEQERTNIHSQHVGKQKQTTRCFFKIKIYITNSFIIIAIYIYNNHYNDISVIIVPFVCCFINIK